MNCSECKHQRGEDGECVIMVMREKFNLEEFLYSCPLEESESSYNLKPSD